MTFSLTLPLSLLKLPSARGLLKRAITPSADPFKWKYINTISPKILLGKPNQMSDHVYSWERTVSVAAFFSGSRGMGHKDRELMRFTQPESPCPLTFNLHFKLWCDLKIWNCFVAIRGSQSLKTWWFWTCASHWGHRAHQNCNWLLPLHGARSNQHWRSLLEESGCPQLWWANKYLQLVEIFYYSRHKCQLSSSERKASLKKSGLNRI